jgi:hypothetical protein
MSDLDTPGKGNQLGKRRDRNNSAKELCQNTVCAGFGKELGNGYCGECLSARGLSARPKKSTPSSSQILAVADVASGSLEVVPEDVGPLIPALPDLGLQVPSVLEVAPEDVAPLFPALPEIGLQVPSVREVLLEVVPKDVAPSCSDPPSVPESNDQSELAKEYRNILRNLPADHFLGGSPPRLDLHPPNAEETPFQIIWGVNVEARWIDTYIGNGTFAVTDLPPNIYVTDYDGHRCDPQSGVILRTCARTLKVERDFPQHYRQGSWGSFQKSHCVLVERKGSVCIDGTFSAQPFLFQEPFHGSIGFGSLLNAGANSEVCNVSLEWVIDPSLPYDIYGVLNKASNAAVTTTTATTTTTAATTTAAAAAAATAF